MEIDLSKQNKELRSSNSSINSNPELNRNRIFYLRISLILINIISAILGYFIFKDKEYYLNQEYNFEYAQYLSIFLLLYSFGMIFTFLFAFILALIIKICVFILNLFTKKNSSPLIKGEERPPTENSIRYINSHADEIALIPQTLTWFVVTTSILYFFDLPYSIFLFIVFQKDKTYCSLKDFRVLYSFLVINFIAGLILFYVILIVLFVKRDGSLRKRQLSIDDNNLENFRQEIRNAMDKVEQ